MIFRLLILTSFLFFHSHAFSFADPQTKLICQSIKQNYYENSLFLEAAKKTPHSTDRLETGQRRYIKSYDRSYCWDHFGLIHTPEGVNKDPDKLSIH
jgi:hypothetical protein